MIRPLLSTAYTRMVIREVLRAGQDAYDSELPELDPSRLGGIRSSEQLVETEAGQRVELLLRRMESASIGISGPRGAGKSAPAESLFGLKQLPELAHDLIGGDAATVLTAQARHAATLTSVTDLPDLADWLAAAAQARTAAGPLEDLTAISLSIGPDTAAVRLTAQVKAYLYYSATLIRTFTPTPSPTLTWLRDAPGLIPIDRLAQARASLAPGAGERLAHDPPVPR